MKRVVLLGPGEQVLKADSELEYRETIVSSYEELIARGATLGSDYTSSREFLGIECLASVLRRRGDQVRVMSCLNEGLDAERAIAEICRFELDVLGVSLLYDLQLYDGLRVARTVRERLPRVRIIFGGPLASVIPEFLLSTFPFIDFVLKGEGEHALVALLEVLENERGLATVPDLVWRGAHGLTHNPVGPTIDLDSLPFASRDVLASLRDRGLPITSAYLSTSRGCKAHCTFCTVPSMVRNRSVKYRYRNPRLVVDEMESLIESYGVRTFYMADDNFLGYGPESRERLLDLAHEIQRRKLALSFHAECRVDSLDDTVLARLRESGFDQLLLGLESGSERTLKRWAKGQTVQQNLAAIETARRFKFDLAPSMILLDWESSLQEVEESVSFIERSRVYECNYPLSLVNKLKVHCGTAAGRRYEKVHGVAPLPPIGNDDDLRRWIQILTYQDTPIENPYVAEFWRCLSLESNRWSLLSYEVVPQLLLEQRRARGPHHRQLFSACRLWRRSLGAMLAGLMRLLVDELGQRESSGAPPGDLRELARRYVHTREMAFFPEGIDPTLRRFIQESVPDTLPAA